MRVSGGAVAVGVTAVVIAAGFATAGALSALPTEHSGAIVQVAPITVGTTFPSPRATDHSITPLGSATPVKAASPQDIGSAHDLRDDGSHTPGAPEGEAGNAGTEHHQPGHGGGHGGSGVGGSGSDHGGPVHTGYPGSP